MDNNLTSWDLEVRNFNVWVPLSKAETSANGEMIVSGPVASEQRDLEGDLMVRSGIWKALVGFFKSYGAHVDWEHMYAKTHDAKWLIGQAREALSVEGRPWLSIRLYKSSALAHEVYNKINDEGHIGISVQGGGCRNLATKEVMASTIKMVTLAPIPMGMDQFMQAGLPSNGIVQIAKALTSCDSSEQCFGLDDSWHSPTAEDHEFFIKALTTGSGIVTDGETGGGALRTQFLTGGDGEVKSCGCASDKKCDKHKDDKKKLEVVSADTDLEKAMQLAGIRDFKSGARELSHYLRSSRRA